MEPLKRETFLSNAEINALFGNIQEIVTFQRQFLQNLDHAVELEADFNNLDHPSQFKVRIPRAISFYLYFMSLKLIRSLRVTSSLFVFVKVDDECVFLQAILTTRTV